MPKKKAVKLSDDARADLTDIGIYISQDNPRRALSFVRELRRACMELSEMPEPFVFVDTERYDRLRRRPYGSYGIYYEVEGNQIIVIRIPNSARELGPLLGPED